MSAERKPSGYFAEDDGDFSSWLLESVIGTEGVNGYREAPVPEEKLQFIMFHQSLTRGKTETSLFSHST